MEKVLIRERVIKADIMERVKQLKGANINGVSMRNAVIYSDKLLANLLNVTQATIVAWKKSGVIHAMELAPRMYMYKLNEVLNDLEAVAAGLGKYR